MQHSTSLGLTLGLATLVACGSARAQPKASASQAPPQVVVDRDPSAARAAARGRALMARGDCPAALDAFDDALRNSQDPAVQRDRGLCHEKLGHPFPAMDDLRAYLTARPDAQDAEAVRDRLARLESESTHGRRAEAGTGAPSDGGARGKAAVSLNGGEGGGDATEATAHGTDAVDAREQRQVDADTSALRRGRGFIIGPYFGARHWGSDQLGWGETFGAALRYSFSGTSTLLGEIGYSTVGASGGTDASSGGLAVFAGYEARLALDATVDNAILIAAGLGYERLKQGSTGLVFSTVIPRGRLGFRHVFGPTIGLELTADAGPAFVQQLDGGASSSTYFVGGTLALVVGF